MEKTKTGITGFDVLIGGGFPKGRNILISGTPGTGKTIFALQYLYNGAAKFNERGLFISFEEKKSNLIKQALQFGWDLEALEKEERITILEIPAREVKESTGRDILKILENGKYSRLVIDSLSALAINTPHTFGVITDINEIFIKRFMYYFINDLKSNGVTSLLISQATAGNMSSDGVSEFICDGIVYIKYESLGGNFSRNMIIRKMREVKNDEDIHPIEITEKGIVVHGVN